MCITVYNHFPLLSLFFLQRICSDVVLLVVIARDVRVVVVVLENADLENVPENDQGSDVVLLVVIARDVRVVVVVLENADAENVPENDQVAASLSVNVANLTEIAVPSIAIAEPENVVNIIIFYYMYELS